MPKATFDKKSFSQCISRTSIGVKQREAVERIAQAYGADDEPWVVGFSGGKDSSALLKLLFLALRHTRSYHKPVTVLYCDTGVEIPLASTLARSVLTAFRTEALEAGLPISTAIAEPPLEERFFFKIIGRGYPPPTDKFRWCTDRLRINPVGQLLEAKGYDSATILVGVREGESATRDETLRENVSGDRYWRKQKGFSSRRLFVPILDFDTIDVWKTLLMIETPVSVPGQKIADLYIDASGECPVVRDDHGAPCGKARFGCWTCTVAKNGTTLRHLISAGHESLTSLLDFRLWLDKHRNNPRYRWKNRRNGQPGPGPMTLTWRRMALEKLLESQKKSGLCLISKTEENEIRRYWAHGTS